MAALRHDDRKRLTGLAGTAVVHAGVIAALLWLTPDYAPPPPAGPGLVAIDITQPPPPEPPPPDAEEAGAAAPESRGAVAAPSPPEPPRPLPSPTPVQSAPDPGPALASGLGAAPGNAAGQGGEGAGSGSGSGGAGRGSGRITPPQRIAGGFTGSDYRAVDLPRGSVATVVVSYRVRRDGSADMCRVIEPSPFDRVDEATCRAIEGRFRFRPAMDEAGQPIDWTIRTDYTWLPR
jgi:protein TonB